MPLIEDEGYYALWASELAVGYYDHPPFVAYLIWPGVSLFGLSEFSVRIGSLLAMAASSILVWDSARQLSGKSETGVWALLFFNVSVLIAGLGTFATPDAPSTLFWTMAVWAAIRATGSGQWIWWILAGVAIGAGGISKFTNAFLGFGFAGWLLLTSSGRNWLRTPKPYVAGVLAFLVMAPYLIWNLQYDWVGLERQLARVEDRTANFIFTPEYLLVTLLLPTPLIALLALRGSVLAGTGRGLLLWTTLPFLLYLLYHSSFAQVQANWTTALHGTFAIWAALFAQGIRPFWRVSAAVSGFIISLVIMLLAWSPFLLFDGIHNPPNQMRGWASVQQTIHQDIAEHGAQWIATTGYGTTGHFFVRFPEIEVWSVRSPERYMFRGPIPSSFCDAPGLLVQYYWQGREPASDRFAQAGESKIIERKFEDTVLATYRSVPVQGLLDRSMCAADATDG